MLSWLRKLVAGGPLSPDQRAKLEEWLAPLGGGLARRALSYIVEGEGEDVLAALAARPSAGTDLGLKGVAAGYSSARLEGFFRSPLPNAGFYLRMGRVLEAARPAAVRALAGARSSVSGAPTWLEPLLWEASTYAPSVWGGHNEVFVSHEVLEAALRAGGAPADAALRALTTLDLKTSDFRLRELLAGIPGLPEAVARHPDAVREALSGGDAWRRAHLLGVLRAAHVDAGPFIDLLAGAACDSAKSVREVGEAWLRAIGEAGVAAVRLAIGAGESGVRARAAVLLARLGGPNEVAFLEQRLEGERSAPVRKAIEAALADLRAAPAASESAATLQLPVVGAGPLPPLGREARAVLGEIASAWYDHAYKIAQLHQRHHPGGALPVRPSEAAIDRWLTLMQTREFTPARATEASFQGPFVYGSGDWLTWARPLLALPELTLGHVVRFALLSGVLMTHDRYAGLGGSGFLPLVKAFQRASGLAFGVREIAAECAAVGVEPHRVGWEFVFAWRIQAGWKDEEIWPYFVEDGSLLEAALGLRALPEGAFAWTDHRLNALAILAKMPALPPGFGPLVWDLALGQARKERAAARRCLIGQPGAGERVLAALADGRQEVREAAAEWLREARDPAAIPLLRKALAREKSERCKTALMVALEALGASLDDLVDRAALSKEAQKGLGKGIPEDLAWFPFAALPSVRWADGAPLDAEVVSWWIVQARKVGSPEPGPLLRCYAERLRPEDARALGTMVLEAWIAHDTALPTEAQAQAQVQTAAAQAQQYAGYLHITPQAYLQQVLQAARGTPIGSAIADKGILAVAGALVAETAAPLVGPYLKQWYGLRAAQCKALLQMLSWVNDPTAAAVLLATATRFRTAGIRKTAEAAVQALAERRGWTVDELGDRTIPTADLEDDGTLELSYGPRAFRARLRPDLTLALEDESGKPLAGLPEPRATDDAEAAKTAKQVLSAGRKQVKTVEKQQRERLYEAMCTQRAWRFEDWQTYLGRHPIVGHLCARLIWAAQAGDGGHRSFRPLGDGTLTGPDDAAVSIAPDASVMLAHPSLLPPEVVSAWARHLADYEVNPLFDQLGRPARALPEEKKEETSLAEFEGHLLEAFKLRGRATKLGYVRGQSEDGGWFYVYCKHFPSLRLEGRIEFSGNSLPEENRTVALQKLSFLRSDPRAADVSEPVPLGEIPPVLLAECWNDLAALAGEGTGYDPDWEKKTSP